ncbi:hypothetical protein ADUPG1_010200, partial [Aduncisulcus paluster]
MSWISKQRNITSSLIQESITALEGEKKFHALLHNFESQVEINVKNIVEGKHKPCFDATIYGIGGVTYDIDDILFRRVGNWIVSGSNIGDGELAFKYAEWTAIAYNYSQVEINVKNIVEGKHKPCFDATIYGIGGVTYDIDDILFRRVGNWIVSGSNIGDGELAFKYAEWTAIAYNYVRKCAFQKGLDEVVVPLSCLCDYCGQRFFCIAKIPCREENLSCGSLDDGNTVIGLSTDPDACSSLELEDPDRFAALSLSYDVSARIGQGMNIGVHSVPSKKLSPGKDKSVWVPLDMRTRIFCIEQEDDLIVFILPSACIFPLDLSEKVGIGLRDLSMMPGDTRNLEDSSDFRSASGSLSPRSANPLSSSDPCQEEKRIQALSMRLCPTLLESYGCGDIVRPGFKEYHSFPIISCDKCKGVINEYTYFIYNNSLNAQYHLKYKMCEECFSSFSSKEIKMNKMYFEQKIIPESQRITFWKDESSNIFFSKPVILTPLNPDTFSAPRSADVVSDITGGICDSDVDLVKGCSIHMSEPLIEQIAAELDILWRVGGVLKNRRKGTQEDRRKERSMGKIISMSTNSLSNPTKVQDKPLSMSLSSPLSSPTSSPTGSDVFSSVISSFSPGRSPSRSSYISSPLSGRPQSSLFGSPSARGMSLSRISCISPFQSGSTPSDGSYPIPPMLSTSNLSMLSPTSLSSYHTLSPSLSHHMLYPSSVLPCLPFFSSNGSASFSALSAFCSSPCSLTSLLFHCGIDQKHIGSIAECCMCSSVREQCEEEMIVKIVCTMIRDALCAIPGQINGDEYEENFIPGMSLLPHKELMEYSASIISFYLFSMFQDTLDEQGEMMWQMLKEVGNNTYNYSIGEFARTALNKHATIRSILQELGVNLTFKRKFPTISREEIESEDEEFPIPTFEDSI